MSPKQILIVAIRLFVIVWCIHTINSGFVGMNAFDGNFSPWQMVPLYLVYAVCWLVLWFFPATIANILLPQVQQEQQTIPKHPAPWLTTGIILIGIWTLSNALRDGIYWFSLYQAFTNTYQTDIWKMLSADQSSAIIMTAAELVIGLILVFRAPQINRLIQKAL